MASNYDVSAHERKEYRRSKWVYPAICDKIKYIDTVENGHKYGEPKYMVKLKKGYIFTKGINKGLTEAFFNSINEVKRAGVVRVKRRFHHDLVDFVDIEKIEEKRKYLLNERRVRKRKLRKHAY